LHVYVPDKQHNNSTISKASRITAAQFTVAHFTVADFTDPTKWLPSLPLPNFPVAQFSVAQFTVYRARHPVNCCEVPPTRLNFVERAFSFAGPAAWNDLSTVCSEKSEPPKHFALTSANMTRIEQN